MNHDDNTGQTLKKKHHAWAIIKEITEHYGPGNEHLGCFEKFIYNEPPPWPARRDVWNLLIGAIAVLAIQFLRSMPH